jgi:hypothetical protein
LSFERDRAEQRSLQRQLEKLKIRKAALEREAERPMNFHRWREMEACDVGRFEMMKKLQNTQVRGDDEFFLFVFFSVN